MLIIFIICFLLNTLFIKSWNFYWYIFYYKWKKIYYLFFLLPVFSIYNLWQFSLLFEVYKILYKFWNLINLFVFEFDLDIYTKLGLNQKSDQLIKFKNPNFQIGLCFITEKNITTFYFCNTLLIWYFIYYIFGLLKIFFPLKV